MSPATTTGGALGRSEALAYIGLSDSEFRKVVAEGHITPRYRGTKPLYLRRELDDFLESLPTEKREAS